MPELSFSVSNSSRLFANNALNDAFELAIYIASNLPSLETNK